MGFGGIVCDFSWDLYQKWRIYQWDFMGFNGVLCDFRGIYRDYFLGFLGDLLGFKRL